MMSGPARRAATLAALVVLLASTVFAQGKTDVVTLVNGDRITCEVSKLERGRLELKTDDIGTIYIEWDNVVREFGRVFPDRPIVDLQPDHPVFHCFYEIDHYPQVPGLGSFLQGRTWEKGGFVSHLRAIQDDRGRAMVLINWNTDMGDGVEWSNAEEYPGYIAYTAEAYRMMINEIVYSLTH